MPPGPDGVKQLIGMYRSAFPDIRFETGEMMVVEATGKVEVAGVEMSRVENGRISASWAVSDALGLIHGTARSDALP